MLFVTQVRILQRLEYPFLLGHENTRQNLFVTNRIFLEPIGHDIVDILNEDDIRVLLIEVLDERTVTTRPEEQLAVFRAERRSVRIGCKRIGRR